LAGVERVSDVGRGRGAAGLVTDRQRRLVEAQLLVLTPRDQVLGIDGAGEMHMQVGALRHALQERAQRGRIGTDGGEARGGDGGIARESDQQRGDDRERDRDQRAAEDIASHEKSPWRDAESNVRGHCVQSKRVLLSATRLIRDCMQLQAVLQLIVPGTMLE
jgi:hypothetical protein